MKRCVWPAAGQVIMGVVPRNGNLKWALPKLYWLFQLFVYNNSITQQENYMSDRVFTAEQTKKLEAIINEGMQVTMEIETLQGGLNDTVKAISEELEIKPGILKKAIRIAHKAEFGRTQDDHELLEQILTQVGKTL